MIGYVAWGGRMSELTSADITSGYEIKPWSAVKKTALTLNPFIAKAINSVSGVDDFPVIVARYSFGSQIVKNGQFHLQEQDRCLPLEHPAISDEVRNLLDYYWQVMPFGMILHNSVETHIELPTQIIPYRLYQPGRTFSLLSIFKREECSHIIPRSYSTTAGSRSLITLPQIAHQQYHKRLSKRLQLPQFYNPRAFSEQWDLFKAISQSRQFQYPWHADIIFFSRYFIEAFDHNPALKNTLLQSIWQGTAFMRNQTTYDLIWSTFIEENLSLALKNSLAVMETVRYLLRIIMQANAAYAPCDNDIAGPIEGFSKALLDIYRIRFYLPVFMQPQHYDGTQPVYYSLQKPFFLHAIPAKNTASQTINIMKQVQDTFEAFKQQILQDQLPFSLEDTLLYHRLQETEVTFYHPKGGPELEEDTASIFNEDPRFNTIQKQFRHYNHLDLPDSSMFFHGCVRVRPKAIADTQLNQANTLV